MNMREKCLETAKTAICTDRNNTYGGSPENSFGVIANMWNTYLKGKLRPEEELDSEDVGLMMVLMKISRCKTGNYHEDNYVDIAGYAACAMEAAAIKNANKPIEEDDF